MKIFVTGGSPDHINHNTVLRSFLVEACEKKVGRENVLERPLQTASIEVKTFRPDLVIVFGSIMPDASDFTGLRKSADMVRAKLAFWLHDDPYEFDFHSKCLPFADLIFSNDRFAALHYDGKPAIHLPLAASPTRHIRPLDHTKNVDIFFCGEAFPNRIQLFKDLSKVLARYKTQVQGSSWPGFLSFAENKRLSNPEHADSCAQSAIVMNVGRQFNLANRHYFLTPSTPGPRTFEAAMTGAVQLFFVGEGLEIIDYFEPGKEIVLFDSVGGFEEKVKELLGDSFRRKAIGEAAQKRCLQEHTYAHRLEKILEIAKISK
jgi:spore maturation protein CgeB